jgi:hypothetical protein
MIRLLNKPSAIPSEWVVVYNCGRKCYPWLIHKDELKWIRVSGDHAQIINLPKRVSLRNVRGSKSIELAQPRGITQIPYQ